LTIQQFRRAVRAITAADYLRATRWLPRQLEKRFENPWGDSRFSVGLWVGHSVAPNNLVSRTGWDNTRRIRTKNVGAIDILLFIFNFDNHRRDHFS
jgi:hypothetical protein